MFFTILEITISMSVVIMIIFLLMPVINKRYSAKWRYFIWLFIALRLVIPFNITLPKAPVVVNQPTENLAVVVHTENTSFPVAVMEEKEYVGLGNKFTDSVNYAPIITVNELLQYIWVSGVVIFILYNLINYWIFKMRVSKCCERVNISAANEVSELLKIKKMPEVVTCEKIISPMLIGFIKPIVILPKTDYSDDEIKVILKHELTHYKRHDLWYKLLLICANGMHWFNPIIYFMVRQANRDLEYSCDDAVVGNEDMEYRKAYSKTILKSMEKGNATNLSVNLNKNVEK